VFLGAVVAMYAVLYFGHIRAVRTREAEREDERKRKHVVASMRQLIAYEKALMCGEGGGRGKGRKKLADAKKLHGLLFDDVENKPVTAIGIAPTDPDYVRLRAALGERAASELRSAIARTRSARTAAAAARPGASLLRVAEADEGGEGAAKRTDEQGEWAVADYTDGLKLRKAMAFAKEQVRRHFPDVAPEVRFLSIPPSASPSHFFRKCVGQRR
jgi:hypothetical protein